MKLHEDMERLEKRQKLKKEKFVRKFMRHIQAVDVQKLVKKASKTRKRHMKEDRLEAFLGVEELPVPEDPQPGEGILNTVVSIADFYYTFRDLLRLPTVSISQLDCELRRQTESPVIARMLAGGVRVMLRQLFARHEAAECIPTNCTYLSLAFQTHGLYNVAEHITDAYFPFLNELLICPLWTIYITPGSLLHAISERKRMELPFESYFYGTYTYKDKAEVLHWMMQCLLDCPELADAVRKMTNMKIGLKQKLKELKKSKADVNPVQREETIAQMKEKVRDLECVTKPFACGCGAELFHFAYDQRKICIRTLSGEDEKWQIFESKRDLEKLYVLEPSHCKRKLRQVMKLAELPLPSEANTEPAGCVLATITALLSTFEQRLTLYLKSQQKQWESQENIDAWHKKVASSSSVHELKWLLLDLAQKGNFAIKPRSAKSHYKKTIWATPEFRDHWEALLENVSGMQELLLLSLFCASNWRHYAIKRESGEKYFPITLFTPEGKATLDVDGMRRATNENGDQSGGQETTTERRESPEPMQVEAPGPPGSPEKVDSDLPAESTELSPDDDIQSSKPEPATVPDVKAEVKAADSPPQEPEAKPTEGKKKHSRHAEMDTKNIETKNNSREKPQKDGPTLRRLSKKPKTSDSEQESPAKSVEPVKKSPEPEPRKPQIIFIVEEGRSESPAHDSRDNSPEAPRRRGRKKRIREEPPPEPAPLRRSARISKIGKPS